jgi:UDP-N-acetylmuramate dehydrogenase
VSPLASLLARVLRGDVTADEPMAPRTSVRVGGPAQVFARPVDVDDLTVLMRAAAGEGAPLTPLGGGANTIVGDLGIRGVVVRLPSEFAKEEVTAVSGGADVVLGAGAPIARIIQIARAQKLVGAEFLVGIPGTIGGAVSMNAGTKAGEAQSIIEEVEVATRQEVRWISRREIPFSYRSGGLPNDAVVTRVRLRLRQGDFAASAAAMEADMAYRRRSQPLTQPNSGSVFRNPPGDYAGRLIESAGLKGRRIGNAQISEVHANFIVNLGGAKAADVVALIDAARVEVRSRFGVALELEVKLVGDFA